MYSKLYELFLLDVLLPYVAALSAWMATVFL